MLRHLLHPLARMLSGWQSRYRNSNCFTSIYTNVFFMTEIILFCMKDGCEKLMRRLEPLIKKHPQFTWQQLVSKSDMQVLNCIIQTELLMDSQTRIT